MEENQLRKKYAGLTKELGVMVKVDQANLSEEMARNSSRMFRINLMKADAEYLKDKAEDTVKVLEARLDKQIRIASVKKKPSEQQIKQRLARSPEICEAREKFFEAKWRFNVCWAAASSIAQKGDQLSNLAYNYRKELEHGFKSRVGNVNKAVENLTKKKG